MKKTLYIQIDNNSLPEGCGEDVEVLDCRCINDFCSMVGDALVSDLKDENGKPFYRLINPVGRLLLEFKSVNKEAFNGIISMWYDYLGELLHKGVLESDTTIKFPQTYIDWLLQNDNLYYESVGNELQKKFGKICVPSEDIIDDVIASFTYKISHTLQEKKDNISFAVFSNPIIRNNSSVVKRVKLDGVEFLRYENWVEINYKPSILDKEDYAFFRLDNLSIGKTRIGDLKNYKIIHKEDNWIICTYSKLPNIKMAFANELLSGVFVGDETNSVFQFLGTNITFKEWSFNKMAELVKSNNCEIEYCDGDIIPVYPEKCNGMNLRYIATISIIIRKEIRIHISFDDYYIGSYEWADLDDKNNSAGFMKHFCVSNIIEGRDFIFALISND